MGFDQLGGCLLVMARVADLDLTRGRRAVDCRDKWMNCTFLASAWLQQSFGSLHDYLRLNRAHGRHTASRLLKYE